MVAVKYQSGRAVCFCTTNCLLQIPGKTIRRKPETKDMWMRLFVIALEAWSQLNHDCRPENPHCPRPGSS